MYVYIIYNWIWMRLNIIYYINIISNNTGAMTTWTYKLVMNNVNSHQ